MSARRSRDAHGESVRMALRTMRAHRLRTALTAMSVMLGAGTIALLVSLATSALATILGGVDAVGGRDLVFLSPQEPERLAKGATLPISRADVGALQGRVAGLERVDYLVSERGQSMLAGTRRVDVDVAIGAAYARYLTQRVVAGRLVDDREDRRVVALSLPVATELFGAAEAAVGAHVVLYGARYEVVGVTEDAPALGFNMGGVTRARAVFVPIEAAERREGVGPVGFAVLRFEPSASHERPISTARAILRHRHGQEDFELFDLGALVHTFDVVFLAIRVLVGLIASVCLVLAGAGIMNVMLASVRQRVREIGVRRALGATRRDIERQLLVESALLGAFGGVVGAAGGTAVAVLLGLAVRAVAPAWRIAPSLSAAAFAAACAMTVGVAFGRRPARVAGAANVVACLRGALS